MLKGLGSSSYFVGKTCWLTGKIGTLEVLTMKAVGKTFRIKETVFRSLEFWRDGNQMSKSLKKKRKTVLELVVASFSRTLFKAWGSTTCNCPSALGAGGGSTMSGHVLCIALIIIECNV